MGKTLLKPSISIHKAEIKREFAHKPRFIKEFKFIKILKSLRYYIFINISNSFFCHFIACFCQLQRKKNSIIFFH